VSQSCWAAASAVLFSLKTSEWSKAREVVIIVVIVIDCIPTRNARVHIGSRGGMQAIRTGACRPSEQAPHYIYN
jgi:hypothetical protein